MPGSVASATSAAASAASTALPPSAAVASPASSDLLARWRPRRSGAVSCGHDSRTDESIPYSGGNQSGPTSVLPGKRGQPGRRDTGDTGGESHDINHTGGQAVSHRGCGALRGRPPGGVVARRRLSADLGGEHGGLCGHLAVIADLAAHDPVTGLTVSQGTTPDGFTGEVLGVLNDGIAPGLDMVMVRLTSTEIDRVGGIWAGMSGSPVYAERRPPDRCRRLRALLRARPRSPASRRSRRWTTISAPRAHGRRSRPRRRDGSLPQHRRDSAAQAAQGFAQLPMPLASPGSAPRAWPHVKKRAYLDKGARAWARRRGRAGTGVEAIVAGGNLALSAAYGDVNIAAVGTATSVCNDRVVGFGHPATFAGKITAGPAPGGRDLRPGGPGLRRASRSPTSATPSARSPTTTRPGSPALSATCRRPRPSPPR